MESILIVDDELNIIKSLKRVFLDTNYNMYYAQSGYEALRILEKEKINMLITDMEMANMNGYQLLKEIEGSNKDTIKIILSGHAEKVQIFKVIKENLANFYLFKPWNNDRLLEIINNLFMIKESLKRNNILEVLTSELRFLQLDKQHYYKLVQKIEREEEIKEIIKCVEESPILTVKILSFVNIAYNAKAGSIEQAFNYLSLADLREIVDYNKANKLIRENSFDHNKCQLVSISEYTNKIIQYIYMEGFKKEVPAEYKIAGLLSNIGLTILQYRFYEQYQYLLSLVCNNGNMLYDLEQKYLGRSHQKIGADILMWWGMPKYITDLLLNFHNPLNTKSTDKEFLFVLHIANYYSHNLIGIIPYQLSEEVFEFLDIERDFITEYCNLVLKNSIDKQIMRG